MEKRRPARTFEDLIVWQFVLSVYEFTKHLILSKGLGYGDTHSLKGQLEEVSKILRVYTAFILGS